ncbi:hypothetical protein [Streptomyces sp. NPDC001404]|uniref:hypothetical protein n=1 Tax=Streptomyces sp. NPDC001404 TaxID=3364571 RepID=UPI00367CB0F7
MQTHELRLTDTNGYTVNLQGAVRYNVPADQIPAVQAELMTLAEADADAERALHLEHAAHNPDPVGAANARSAAGRIRATDYRVRIHPPVA